MKKAIIAGVGALNGLGSELSHRFAQENLDVTVVGRTEEKIVQVCESIKNSGLSANPYVCDVTNENEVKKLFDLFNSDLELVVYNAGNNMPGKIVEMDSSYFEDCWRICCYGAFLFSKYALLNFMNNNTPGKLFFTGASASLRGKSNFGAFNSAKGAMRNLAQALAKEYALNNIHVAHVIVDGPLDGERIRIKFPDFIEKFGQERLINIQGVADGYIFLYHQKKSSWSFEIDLRTYKEDW